MSKNKKIFWTVIIIVATLVGALLIGTASAGAFDSFNFSREPVIILTVFLIVLLVLLGTLLFVILFVKADSSSIYVDKTNSFESSHTTESRFCMLSQIDGEKRENKHYAYDSEITLKKICEDFRNYTANESGLYYEVEDIRKFIAGLSVSKILILQGMSGTGKTSLAHAFGSYVDNPSTVIPVQPMWKERTDLVGYYNEFTKRFNETLLLRKMYEANGSEDIYITVLDEMNIARVEYYFAEFLSVLELPNPEERYLDVVSDKWENDPKGLVDGKIRLPKNMWFIGTANNDDSTFSISDKVYDRAMILDLDKRSDKFFAPKTEKLHISAEKFEELVQNAIQENAISQRNVTRLLKLDEYLKKHFHVTFGNRIMKQITSYIPVYISCGGEELSALDDILSKKVIRKLEMQNPIYLKNSAQELCAYLDELFGKNKMPLCKERILHIERNA